MRCECNIAGKARPSTYVDGKEGKMKGMAVRMYSINQEKVDEACWTWFEDIILIIASDKLLKRVADRISRKLKEIKD